MVITKDAHLKFTVNNIVVGDDDVDLTNDSRPAVQLIKLIAGDINGDGIVEMGDFLMIMNHLNITAAEAAQLGIQFADINGDCILEMTDFLIIANNLNTGPVIVN